MRNVLLIAKRTGKINAIETILTEYFHSVSIISEPTGTPKLPLYDHFDLIVLTDSLDVKPDGDFLSCLRSRFPGAKFLYLADEIAPETEMSLRAGGLIFLGSYEHFVQCADRILKSVDKRVS